MPIIRGLRDLAFYFPEVYGINVPNPAMRFWKFLSAEAYCNDQNSAAGEDLDASGTGYLGIIVAPHRLQVTSAYIISIDGDIAANGTDYCTFDVTNWTAAGTPTVATVNTSVLGLTQYAPRAMTVDTAYDIVEKGEILEIDISKAGSGVALNEFGVVVVYKAIDRT